MNCRSAESLFSSIIEDELSQEERRALEAHLLACRRCSVALRDLRATMSLVRSLPEVAPGPHFEEDLFARIRSGEGLHLPWTARFRELLSPLSPRPILAAGVTVCAVWIAVALFQPGRVERESAVPPIASSVPSVPVEESAQPPAPTAEPEAIAARLAESRAGLGSATTRTGAPDGAAPTPVTRGSIVRSALAASDSAGWGDRLEPQYQDEYILDQFLLDRAGPQDPTVVPVRGGANDRDVIITF